MNISDKTYDILKFIGLAVAPVVTMITAILAALDLPYGAIITAIVAAVGTCIGELVVILKKMYDDKHKKEEDDSEGGGNDE